MQPNCVKKNIKKKKREQERAKKKIFFCSSYCPSLNMYSQTMLCIQIKTLNAESVQGHYSLSATVSLKFDESYINENALAKKIK